MPLTHALIDALLRMIVMSNSFALLVFGVRSSLCSATRIEPSPFCL